MSNMKQYSALGYHIYAGGFTVGVSKHFNVLAHLEHSNYGVATTKLNFPKLPVYTKELDWPKRFASIDLFYGNPPCALFSVVGSGKGMNDPRLYYHERFQQLVKELQPTVAVCESVRGLLKQGQQLIDDFCSIDGYAFYIVEHDAQYHSVPQIRKRVFLVASKVKLDWFSQKLTEPILSIDALKGVKNIDKVMDPFKGKYDKIIKITKPGEPLVKVFDRTKQKIKRNAQGIVGRPPFCMVRLDADKVSGTVLGAGGIKVHPTQNRFINLNEFKALCSYPQDYKFSTKHLESATKEMTRAVMPGVGDWLARVVRHGLKRGQVPDKLIEHVNVKPL